MPGATLIQVRAVREPGGMSRVFALPQPEPAGRLVDCAGVRVRSDPGGGGGAISLRKRLADLEARVRYRAVAVCPACGTTNPCGIYLAVEADGSAVPRCMSCGSERPRPGGLLPAFLRWMIEAI